VQPLEPVITIGGWVGAPNVGMVTPPVGPELTVCNGDNVTSSAIAPEPAVVAVAVIAAGVFAPPSATSGRLVSAVPNGTLKVMVAL